MRNDKVRALSMNERIIRGKSYEWQRQYKHKRFFKLMPTWAHTHTPTQYATISVLLSLFKRYFLLVFIVVVVCYFASAFVYDLAQSIDITTEVAPPTDNENDR